MLQQKEDLMRQLREKQKRVEYLERQLSDMQQQKENLQGQVRELKQQKENLQRQLKELQQKSQRQLSEMEQREENLQGQVRELKQQKENLQRQLKELQQNSQRQLSEMQQREEDLQRQLREVQQRGENLQRQLRAKQQREEYPQGQFWEIQQREGNLQRELRELQQNSQRQLSEMQQREENLQRQLREMLQQDWVIARDEIQMTDRCLAMGGWGSVVEGTYCGCPVAVKQIHDLIHFPYIFSLFEREMNIASKCRHPHLLQFIGATNDGGNPLFVTELMEKCLRALLEQRPLSETEIAVISLDVARALNYLHQKKPEPIIHWNVNSANVLLWRQGDQWRAKVSNCGTANFMQQTMTVTPGAMIYSAPEALAPNQTTKVSFLCT